MYDGPSVGAVDHPPHKLELEVGRRRHRRITGPAGLLLFICMFLPAVKGCNQPVYPLEMPMFLHPYLFGLVFAVAGVALTVRGLRRTITALRVLAWLTLATAIVMVVWIPEIGIVQLALGAGLLAIIGTSAGSEKRAAGIAIAVGATSLIWFGLWASTEDALVGVYLASLASLGLLIGGLLWLGEAGAAPPIEVPRAVARRPPDI